MVSVGRIGIDIGKRHDPSAIVVVLVNLRENGAHFTVPFLKRLDLNLAYPEQIAQMVRICVAAQKNARMPMSVLVDTTGVGDAVYDMLKPQLRDAGVSSVISCRFMSGDRVVREGAELRIGKSYFVSRLQVLSESGRIHLPRTPEAFQLSQEMLDFDIDVNESGKATYGAIRPGTHDDLVVALGLACIFDIEPSYGQLIFRCPTKISPTGPDWLSQAVRHHVS